MPVTQIFSDLLEKQISSGKLYKRAQLSRRWLRREAMKINVSPSYIKTKATQITHLRLAERLEPGTMLFYNYNPKTKKDLPYYDTFPLIFVVGPANYGFYGLNLHYLPYQQRASMMDALHGLTSDKRYDSSTKVKLSYNALKRASKLRWFKPCFKHYLSKHVKSRKILVESPAWDIALFLPIARFKNASQEEVWEDVIWRFNNKK